MVIMHCFTDFFLRKKYLVAIRRFLALFLCKELFWNIYELCPAMLITPIDFVLKSKMTYKM